MLIVNNNLYSLSAQGKLNIASAGLAKNIERISSGLRINRASDDASGMAVSELMRAQIKGLKRASLNSQDAVSYLQTAEGGMNAITDMLQRMRELSVQAANGTLTTNDRQTIQKEIDQLRDEIDRVSASTEFNTRKLLNGNGTALWSASNKDINAIIRGTVAEGNYRLDFNSKAGQNYIYKSDIMTRINPVELAEIIGNNPTNVARVLDPKNMPETGTDYYKVTIHAATCQTTDTATITIGSGFNTMQVYQQRGSNWITTQAVTGTAGVTFDGYIEVEFRNSTAIAGDFSDVEILWRAICAKTGVISEWYTATASITGELVLTSSALLTFTEVKPDGSVVNSTVGLSAIITLSANPNCVNSDGFVTEGDKALFALNRTIAAVDLQYDDGMKAIKISEGPHNMLTTAIVSFDGRSMIIYGDEVGGMRYAYVDVVLPWINTATGTVNIGKMTFQFAENTKINKPQEALGSFYLKINLDEHIADSRTQLRDISRFITADGRNILEHTQELTIYGNGKKTTIYIQGTDTINDLVQRLNRAILDELGMGADRHSVSAGGSYNDINKNIVRYVSATDSLLNSNEAVSGTFVIQSALLGNDSELIFIGDEALINALSLATIQKGKNSEMTVTVRDAHNGNLIGTETVGDGVLAGVIQGVDVVIDSRAGIVQRWDENLRKIVYGSDPASKSAFLHIVDNRTDIQVGANKGQSFNVSVAQLDSKSLGLGRVSVVSIDHAAKSITMLDRAIERLNSARASIGAQINRLEHAITGLGTTHMNLTASESRIRDLDMAEETADFTKNQLLVQSGISMLAQANQLPNMVLQLIGN